MVYLSFFMTFSHIGLYVYLVCYDMLYLDKYIYIIILD